MQGRASCHPREQGLPPGNMSGGTRPWNTAEKKGLPPENMAHLQSSVFKLSKDLIDSIHEEGIVAYTS